MRILRESGKRPIVLLPPSGEGHETRERERVTAATGTVNRPVGLQELNQIAEKRLDNDATEKAGKTARVKTASFQPP